MELGSLPIPPFPVEQFHWQHRHKEVFHMQNKKQKVEIMYSGADKSMATKVYNKLVFDGLARDAIKRAGLTV